jgi:transposase
MREWLPASEPVGLVIELIGRLDTSAFHASRRTGGAGRAGYDPDMLLTLLVWAWMQRESSSRRIQRLCSRDVSFRVICAGDVPDHVTIARFRQGFGDAVEELFAEVLVLCARLGLGQVGLVALDGTKIAAPASKGANRTEDGLRRAADAERQAERARAREAAREASARHAARDAEEDARFGEAMGDEMPDDPGTGGSAGDDRSRSARIAAALAELEAERERAEAERAKAAARRQARIEAKDGRPVDGRPPAGSEIELAEAAVARARAELAERHRRWLTTGGGRNPCPDGVEASYRVRRALARLERARDTVARRAAREAARRPDPAPVRNITDPQSRLQPVQGGGWLQGYNAQAVATCDGIVLATAVGNSSADAPEFISLMQAASAAADRIGAGPIGTVLADAGYLSADNLTEPGPDRLIAVGKRRDLERAARSGEPPDESSGAESIQAMRDRLRTPEGMASYRQRGPIIETVFGHGKHNLRFTRFTGCGLARARAEWTFHTTVHNLAKIMGKIAGEPALLTG